MIFTIGTRYVLVFAENFDIHHTPNENLDTFFLILSIVESNLFDAKEILLKNFLLHIID